MKKIAHSIQFVQMQFRVIVHLRPSIPFKSFHIQKINKNKMDTRAVFWNDVIAPPPLPFPSPVTQRIRSTTTQLEFQNHDYFQSHIILYYMQYQANKRCSTAPSAPQLPPMQQWQQIAAAITTKTFIKLKHACSWSLFFGWWMIM